MSSVWASQRLRGSHLRATLTGERRSWCLPPHVCNPDPFLHCEWPYHPQPVIAHLIYCQVNMMASKDTGVSMAAPLLGQKFKESGLECWWSECFLPFSWSLLPRACNGIGCICGWTSRVFKVLDGPCMSIIEQNGYSEREFMNVVDTKITVGSINVVLIYL